MKKLTHKLENARRDMVRGAASEAYDARRRDVKPRPSRAGLRQGAARPRQDRRVPAREGARGPGEAQGVRAQAGKSEEGRQRRGRGEVQGQDRQVPEEIRRNARRRRQLAGSRRDRPRALRQSPEGVAMKLNILSSS